MAVDLTAIGDVNIDLLTSPVRSYPKKDLQIRIPWMRMEVGGGAAHFAMATSKLGMKTRLIGLVGKDVFGDYIVDKIERFGVENKVRRTKNERTGISFGIHFEDGSRSLLTFRGTNSIFSTRFFNRNEIRGKVLYIGGYNLLENFQEDVYKILSYAKRKGMLTALEPDLKSGINCDLKEVKRSLKLVDFFFPDLEEGRIITSEKDERKIVRKILKFGCKIVALKLGKRGCIVADRTKIRKIKGFKVKAVNTTGAGDFFNAGFVFGYLKYRNLERAGIFANATGALSVTKFGDERFPSLREINRLVKKYER